MLLSYIFGIALTCHFGTSMQCAQQPRGFSLCGFHVAFMLTQNQHLTPSTQQAEQSWLNARARSEACQSIFLKLTKDEK
jgi:hypothetical protein